LREFEVFFFRSIRESAIAFVAHFRQPLHQKGTERIGLSHSGSYAAVQPAVQPAVMGNLAHVPPWQKSWRLMPPMYLNQHFREFGCTHLQQNSRRLQDLLGFFFSIPPALGGKISPSEMQLLLKPAALAPSPPDYKHVLNLSCIAPPLFQAEAQTELRRVAASACIRGFRRPNLGRNGGGEP